MHQLEQQQRVRMLVEELRKSAHRRREIFAQVVRIGDQKADNWCAAEPAREGRNR
jgi:hypothetical protein